MKVSKHLWRFASLIAVLLALTACVEPSDDSRTAPSAPEEETVANDSLESGYPTEVIDRFLERCTGGDPAMQRPCNCAIEELQQQYSFEEFVELEREIEAGRDDGTVLADLFEACQ
ncbi:hypothetical protein NEA10_12370 [Phormidium yuhuli AB48]|uniref:Lipoprotein n=1 Tax=Phormidium yuhuli AB48 TaxID=2940671 RepID=A0ABY5ANC9_9CYAN|nr:hypothetical protein [Phormidium yuhuli]USR89673.1 hypothetical protein NEA10_12370 [Phormidium yuhuli AB48]